MSLRLKSDSEPAMRGLQRAIRETGKVGTHLLNSPASDPQGNGVAERAVQEYVGILRRLKLGLEYRLGV